MKETTTNIYIINLIVSAVCQIFIKHMYTEFFSFVFYLFYIILFKAHSGYFTKKKRTICKGAFYNIIWILSLSPFTNSKLDKNRS